MNENRIVPVSCSDLLALYKTMLNIAGTSTTNLDAVGVGEFVIESNPSGKVFATEPISKLSIDESVTAYDLYFVPAFDFVNPFGDGAEIEADGKTLYEAVLAEGSVTVSKVSA
jgi:hypothetical protein